MNPVIPVAIFLLGIVVSCRAAQAEDVQSGIRFSAPEEENGEAYLSSNGVVALEWTDPARDKKAVYVLEQSNDPEFQHPVLRYRGPDSGSYLTGLAEGKYYFRVKGAGDWAEPLEVDVRFIDRTRLFLLVTVGFVVCASTATAILLGHARTRREAE